jgi:hypothetical protein
MADVWQAARKRGGFAREKFAPPVKNASEATAVAG